MAEKKGRPQRAARLHVRLGYEFAGVDQRGAELDNPLFALLQAVHDNGSIVQAAKALGRSYRHVWGTLRTWEAQLGEPLVQWSQGQRGRLSDFGQRLLWA